MESENRLAIFCLVLLTILIAGILVETFWDCRLKGRSEGECLQGSPVSVPSGGSPIIRSGGLSAIVGAVARKSLRMAGPSSRHGNTASSLGQAGNQILYFGSRRLLNLEQRFLGNALRSVPLSPYA